MQSKQLFDKLSEMLESRCTPDFITELGSKEIFVFGSKPDGNHLGGAAKIALERFGAKIGKGEGYSGNSYAIPVHRYKSELMEVAIKRFIDFARTRPELIFYVLPIGCGQAKMKTETIAKMFKPAIEVKNILLPAIFIKSLRKSVRISKDEPLPIKYVSYDIDAATLQGRIMGLMMEISKRTSKPITFEDEILKEDNILLHAFLRTAAVTTPEEQRVLNALMEESKRMSQEEKGKKTNDTIRAVMFVKGWKFDAIAKFEAGGSIYDLLEFKMIK